jgi:hypothetical protein
MTQPLKGETFISMGSGAMTMNQTNGVARVLAMMMVADGLIFGLHWLRPAQAGRHTLPEVGSRGLT